jgi:aspartate-semialdehyde dehydrogenase
LSKNYNVAILGATGAVGTELLALLEERNFPLANLKLLASERSAGQSIKFLLMV